MAQSGYTPISLYHSTTAGVEPDAADLVDGELALNIADGYLFFKRSGVVENLAGLSGYSGYSGYSGATGPTVYPGSGIAVSTGSAWTTSLTAPSGTVVGTTDTQTLTNKRITPRIGTVASASTITPTSDTVDQYNITALATTATFAIPSGTPTDGQKLAIRIKDNGTARTLNWTTSAGGYRVIGTTLPTNTVANKTYYVGCVYNSADAYWDVLAVCLES